MSQFINLALGTSLKQKKNNNLSKTAILIEDMKLRIILHLSSSLFLKKVEDTVWVSGKQLTGSFRKTQSNE